MSDPVSKCVVGPIDKATRAGRDPFAPPGVGGNRWIKYGCDGPIPAKHRSKVEEAVNLAYALANKPAFTQMFDKLIQKLSPQGGLSYLDALNRISLNLAETSTNSIVQQEVQEALEAKRLDPTYKIEGGFTIGRTGQVWLRQFALKDWTTRHIAGLISHEATHVAGAPGDLVAEVVLAGLDRYGYARPQ
jgi:hypothetical protein